MTRFQKILVPVDFSAHSARALEVGIDLAKRTGAALGIIHVYQPAMYSTIGGYMLPQSMTEAATPAVLTEMLARTSDTAREAELPNVETRVLEGEPTAEIVRFARAGDYDLIVVGTHGRTGIQHALIGSVAARVVRKAHCAVLAVRLDDQLES